MKRTRSDPVPALRRLTIHKDYHLHGIGAALRMHANSEHARRVQIARGLAVSIWAEVRVDSAARL